MRRRWILFAVAVAALSIDQLTKLWIESTLPLGDLIPLFSFFNLVHVLNTGAAFSFLADQAGWQRWFFIALGAGISGALLFSIIRQPLQKDGLSFALLIGGAMGNVTDRIYRSAVVDWLDFYVNQWHWPAFNFADIFIVTAAALVCLRTMQRNE